MPTFTGKAFANFYKNILGINQTGNTGVDATTRNVQDGAGNNTSISLSDDVLKVQPLNDNTTRTFNVRNSGGSEILSVNTTDSQVLVGVSQTPANTQYAYFGMAHSDSGGDDFSADNHFAIPFGGAFIGGTNGANYNMGSSTDSSFNDTEPATSLTISNSAFEIARCYWYVCDNITIDAVKWLHAADTTTGDVSAAYLMGYSVDLANGSTSGDLSSGTKLASSPNRTGVGSEQIYYNDMTIHSADVDAGKVILFTFASDTVNSDYTINATVKYHLR